MAYSQISRTTLTRSFPSGGKNASNKVFALPCSNGQRDVVTHSRVHSKKVRCVLVPLFLHRHVISISHHRSHCASRFVQSVYVFVHNWKNFIFVGENVVMVGRLDVVGAHELLDSRPKKSYAFSQRNRECEGTPSIGIWLSREPRRAAKFSGKSIPRRTKAQTCCDASQSSRWRSRRQR